MTGCSLTEGQTSCFRQGRQKQPMVLMGGKLWTRVVAFVSCLGLLHLSIHSWIFKGNLLINWWSKTCSTPQFNCHTPKITLFYVRLSGRCQSGVKDEADHLVAVLVFVPALQHLQPLAGSLHLCVFLLLEKKTPKWCKTPFLTMPSCLTGNQSEKVKKAVFILS